MPSASRSAAAISRALIATSIPAYPSAMTRHSVSPDNVSFTTRRTPHVWSCRSSRRRESGGRTASGIQLGKRAAQKRQPVAHQSVLRLGEWAPDGGGAGDGLVVWGEGLDDHGAVVTDLAQSSGDCLP